MRRILLLNVGPQAVLVTRYAQRSCRVRARLARLARLATTTVGVTERHVALLAQTGRLELEFGEAFVDHRDAEGLEPDEHGDELPNWQHCKKDENLGSE